MAYNVYLLHTNGGGKTYIGMTNEPERRLEQHNRVKSGGARSTAGHIWKHACVINGFPDKTSALQFEWMWKHISKKMHRIPGKMEALLQLLRSGKSTSSSVPFILLDSEFFMYVPAESVKQMEKIDSWKQLGVYLRAPIDKNNERFKLSFPFPSRPSFPFQMSAQVTSVTIEDMRALAHQVEELSLQLSTMRAEMARLTSVEAVVPKKRGRKPKVAAEVVDGAVPAVEGAEGAEVVAKKRGRKPKVAGAETDASDSSAPKKRGRKPKVAEAVAAAPAAEVEAVAAAAPPAVAAEAVVAAEAAPKKKRTRKPKVAGAPVEEGASASSGEESASQEKKKVARKPKVVVVAPQPVAV
jgi:predicted GIY-YIG superfamily endonuclease